MKKDGREGPESERFPTLFESLDDGFCVIEKVADEPLDFRYLEANHTFAIQAGIDNVVGRTIRDVVPAETEEWYELYDQVVCTGKPIRFERTLATNNRLLEGYAFRVDEASARRVGVIFKDVTARAEADDSRARLSAIVESSDDAIVSKDLDGIIKTWNAGAERLFGYTSEEVVGQPLTILIPEYLPDEEMSVLTRIRRGEPVEHYDTVRKHKDGTLIAVSLSVSPILDSKGRVIGASNITRDIRERRRSEEQLAEADRRKTEFLAMLAHELRNPLAPILGSIEMLRQLAEAPRAGAMGAAGGDAEPEARTVALGVLQRQVAHMVRLIDDLLDVGRISRGKIGLRRSQVALAQIVNHAVEAFLPVARENGQRLSVALPDEPIQVDADPTRLAQIIGNLLNNASKFTDRDGHISLDVRRGEPGTPDLSIAVRDTGIGIAGDQLTRIFDMFTQADTSLDRTSTGLGIGLTLVKTLAELHGGRVEAQSEGLGHGSTFVVHLPIVSEACASDVPAKPEAHASAPPMSVLVVDDNKDSAEMLAMLLEFAGHDTYTAHDGLAAVEAATRLQPDVIVLDIGLPGLDGYAAAETIRSRQGDKPPILIALTGWGQEEDRRRAEEAGFDAHVVKPLDEARFSRLLAELTSARASRPSGQGVT